MVVYSLSFTAFYLSRSEQMLSVWMDFILREPVWSPRTPNTPPQPTRLSCLTSGRFRFCVPETPPGALSSLILPRPLAPGQQRASVLGRLIAVALESPRAPRSPLSGISCRPCSWLFLVPPSSFLRRSLGPAARGVLQPGRWGSKHQPSLRGGCLRRRLPVCGPSEHPPTAP